MRHGLVRGELGLELGVPAVEGDEGALVAHGVAVVGRGEHRDALAVVGDLRENRSKIGVTQCTSQTINIIKLK